MRLNPHAPVFALAQGGVRVGIANPITVDDLSTRESAFVATLEGGRHVTDVDRARFPRALAALEAAGVLETDRTEGHGAHVRVHGMSRTGRRIAAMLAEAKIPSLALTDSTFRRAHAAASSLATSAPWPTVVAGDDRQADVTVIVAFGSAAATVTRDLMARDEPHIAVLADEAGTTVTGVIRPGTPPCTACADLTRADADKHWPLVAIQCRGREPGARAGIDDAAAAVAVMAVLAHLRAEPPSPWMRVTRAGIDAITVQAHPACGCAELSRS